MSHPHLKEYLELWIQLDDLWLVGKGESPEADDLRERMDFPYYQMTPEEILEFESTIDKLGRSP